MDTTEQRRAQDQVSDPTAAIVIPALQAGAVCGGAGFLFGGAVGIVRGAPPFLFAAGSSIQIFSLATVFTGTRGGIIRAWTPGSDSLPAKDLTKASALAGCLAGGTVGSAVGFLARRRANPIPGAIVFALLGAAGQHVYNGWSVQKDTDSSAKVGFWKRMSEKSWSPVKIMTDEEYAELLRQKMLKLDVEISVLDDKINSLHDQRQNPRTKPNATDRPQD